MNEKTKKTLAIGFIGLTAIAGASAYGMQIADNQSGQEECTGDMHGFGHAKDSMQRSGFGPSDGFERGPEGQDIDDGTRAAIDQAIEDNNYDKFVELTDKDITQEQFEDLVNRHIIHLEVESAIETEDYDSWVSAVSQMPHGKDIIDIVTEDEFATFIEMHNSISKGDFDTAKELGKEIGIEGPQRHEHRGHGMHMGLGQDAEIRNAIETEDYTTFIQALNDAGKTDFAQDMTEEQFQQILEDHQEAQEIRGQGFGRMRMSQHIN